MEVLELASLGIVACILFFVWLLAKKLPIKAYSPIYILIGFYLVNIIFGYSIYSYSDFPSDILFDLGSLVTKGEMQGALLASLSLMLAFCLGAVFNVYILRPACHMVIYPGNCRSLERNRELRIIKSKYREKRSSERHQWLFFIAFMPIILLIVGVGPDNLLSRSDYLAEQQHELTIAGKVLAMIGVVLSGYLYANSRSWLGRGFCLFLFVIYEAIFFSLASRRFAFVPAMFMLGVILNRQDSKVVVWLFILSMVSALFLMQIPLFFREQSSYGLLPFLTILIDGTFVEPKSGHGTVLFAILTIIFAMPVTAYTMHADSLSVAYLLTSISPLPGFLTDWPHIQGYLRLNDYVPYTALGELLNYGVFVGWSYFFVVGVFVSYIDLHIRAELVKGRLFYVAVMFGLLMIFILTLWQYNLRSATRILYYVLLAQMLFLVLRRVKKALLIST